MYQLRKESLNGMFNNLKNKIMRTLYRTQEDAKKALKKSGKTGYLSTADNRSNLDIDYDSFGGEDLCWSGEVQAYRTADGDIFAWWE